MSTNNLNLFYWLTCHCRYKLCKRLCSIFTTNGSRCTSKSNLFRSFTKRFEYSFNLICELNSCRTRVAMSLVNYYPTKFASRLLKHLLILLAYKNILQHTWVCQKYLWTCSLILWITYIVTCNYFIWQNLITAVRTILGSIAIINSEMQSCCLTIFRKSFLLVFHQGIKRIKEDCFNCIGTSLLIKVTENRVHEALCLSRTRT